MLTVFVYVHNPLNYDTDYRIFNMPTQSFNACIYTLFAFVYSVRLIGCLFQGGGRWGEGLGSHFPIFHLWGPLGQLLWNPRSYTETRVWILNSAWHSYSPQRNSKKDTMGCFSAVTSWWSSHKPLALVTPATERRMSCRCWNQHKKCKWAIPTLWGSHERQPELDTDAVESRSQCRLARQKGNSAALCSHWCHGGAKRKPGNRPGYSAVSDWRWVLLERRCIPQFLVMSVNKMSVPCTVWLSEWERTVVYAYCAMFDLGLDSHCHAVFDGE